MLDQNNVKIRIQTVWIILIGVVVSVLLLSGCGAEKPKVVGILSGLKFNAGIVDGFKAKMTELGYKEGENITYDVQATEGVDLEAYKRILNKFVADKVDLIFVFPTEPLIEAKKITEGTNIPVVFANVLIEGSDLVKSVREPGGNMTGVRYPGTDMSLKRFEIIHELFPEAKRLLVPYQQGIPVVPSQLEALRQVAKDAGVTLVEFPANNLAEVEADLQARAKLADVGFDAMVCLSEPLVTKPEIMAAYAKFSAEHKTPIGGCPIFPDSHGSLFGLSTDYVAVGKLAAPAADKILKGTSAGTIPIYSPEPSLTFSYKVAQEWGLTVPESILMQADEIIR